jgi:hypothetical protein
VRGSGCVIVLAHWSLIANGVWFRPAEPRLDWPLRVAEVGAKASGRIVKN